MPRSAAADTKWLKLVLVSGALCLIVGGAVLAFAWPVARTAPRDVPVGVVGAFSVAPEAGLDLRAYADEPAARRAIAHRDVYGAFVVSGPDLTLLEASAASPAVAGILTDVAARGGRRVRTVDVVPLSSDDPTGSILGITPLPLTVCGVMIATGVALVAARMRAWWELIALVAVAAVGGFVLYLIVQTWLGALPHQPVATWASLAATVLAISATASGLIALFGSAGTALAGALLVLIGNSFSGALSAPDLLPAGVEFIGRYLPPGAGANLLRSVTYFDGYGWVTPAIVLACWTALGCAAVIAGHQRAARAA